MSGTSASYKGGLIHSEKLTDAYHEAPYSEAVFRFVLLAEMLRDSGLCARDIRKCLDKYVRNLAPHYRAQLHKHLPNTNKVREPAFEVSVRCLSTLGRDGNLPAEHIIAAMRAARLRLAEDPNWNALWAADMARLRLSITDKALGDSLFKGKAALLVREAWLSLFGLLWANKHLHGVCKCPNKFDFALSGRLYNADIAFNSDAERLYALEGEISSIADMSVPSLYTPNLAEEKKVCDFSSHVLAAHWRNENFLAARARLPEFNDALSTRTLKLIQDDNRFYKHRSWVPKEKAPVAPKKEQPRKMQPKRDQKPKVKGQKAPPKADAAPFGISEKGKITLPVVRLPKPIASGAKKAE
ncbi:hypothetical protein B0T14DRAFT_571225 [Immersiella caudata]|uniref:Uncharacterized protein n=1 Tax=Immersiella caudata TaxID=314043 RepID=A0AA39U586_9PEZI|nr:hypothetical protein B0T14DRAFT_571225 [Immersiella caudata]